MRHDSRGAQAQHSSDAQGQGADGPGREADVEARAAQDDCPSDANAPYHASPRPYDAPSAAASGDAVPSPPSSRPSPLVPSAASAAPSPLPQLGLVSSPASTPAARCLRVQVTTATGPTRIFGLDSSFLRGEKANEEFGRKRRSSGSFENVFDDALLLLMKLQDAFLDDLAAIRR